jgi:DNA repair exonuclease SbcCD ATPase subunit
MKIRSVELVNFRKFVGTVRVADIGEGLNVLVGRNEFGKSTLLEAINAVIFEKAKSTSQQVKSFRHFVNGTVPEVKLGFDLDGKSWTIQKRFAGQAGKATLTCSDKRRFEDEAAESELQRLLGFSGGRAGSEPGIWGTLWVRQGQSFGDPEVDEHARRTLQGCLEAQVGVVTGGMRGQKIPKAIKEALDEIRSTRGPRGRFKASTDRLEEVRASVAALNAKRNELIKYMDELTQQKRELKDVQADWNEDTHQSELAAERDKRITAVSKVTEIEAARSDATLAEERAGRAQKLVAERAKLVAETGQIEVQINTLETEIEKAKVATTDAQLAFEVHEKKLTELRERASRNGELSRRLDRIRSAVALDVTIKQHEATLAKAVTLVAEARRLSEAIGRIVTTDEDVTRIEEALTEAAAAEAAVNAVATTVSIAIDETAWDRVHVDDKLFEQSAGSFPVVTKTVIGIDGVGKITIDPQIKNRDTLLDRMGRAKADLKVSLEAAGTEDLSVARRAAALRREYERRLAEVHREIVGLAPGDRSTGLKAGLDALRNCVSELRGRLNAEMEKLILSELPEAAHINNYIEATYEEATQLAADIQMAENRLAGPRGLLAEAVKSLQNLQERLAGLNGTFETKNADLAAGRATTSDEQLAAEAEALSCETSDKKALLTSLEQGQVESVEAIDARIGRLEGAASNYRKSVAQLNNDITRLTVLIEANEGAGVEEALDASQAELERLTRIVKDFQQEAAVLQLLLDTLETAEREAKNRYLAPVVSRVEPYLKTLIPGARLVLDEQLHITAIERDGAHEEFGRLSEGTQEQLAVLTRIAFAELLLGQGRPAAVILDDALAFSDDQRIESMFDILMRASAHMQIIVLTCRKRLFSRLGALTLQIEEDRLTS